MSASVVEIAQRVRFWAEQNNIHGYPDLNCMCGIASAKLHENLRREGVQCKIACSSQHVFNIVDDKYVVDITATQFYNNHPPVLMIPISQALKYYWTIDNTFHSVKDFVDYQHRDGWPKKQIPWWVKTHGKNKS